MPSRTEVIGIVVALVVVGSAFSFASFMQNPLTQSAGTDGALKTDSFGVTTGGLVTSQTGLKYEDVVVGTGEEAKPGMMITAHYTGTFQDGKVFDSSVTRGQPFEFTLGKGQVIKGWDEGIAGMKVGGKRKLVVPPELGYGSAGIGPIPPNATLNFEVELLGVKAAQ